MLSLVSTLTTSDCMLEDFFFFFLVHVAELLWKML